MNESRTSASEEPSLPADLSSVLCSQANHIISAGSPQMGKGVSY